MSFSFIVAGTKEEALSSLDKVNVNENAVGDSAIVFVRELLEADGSASTNDTQYVRYNANVSGHSGLKSLTSLNISFSAQLYPKPNQEIEP
jgi:hypothetical protein